MTRQDHMSLVNLGIIVVACAKLVLIGAAIGAEVLWFTLAFVVTIAAACAYVWWKYR